MERFCCTWIYSSSLLFATMRGVVCAIFSTALTIIDGLHLDVGQCPLLVPSSIATKIPSQLAKKRPNFITIAHRGASYSLPEHTIPAYRLALELGADYIEPDLVATKGNYFFAMNTSFLCLCSIHNSLLQKIINSWQSIASI